jgi:hypothetical protein
MMTMHIASLSEMSRLHFPCTKNIIITHNHVKQVRLQKSARDWPGDLSMNGVEISLV